VNTRLQVEHPVSEEVAGLDLVREQFRIAAGEPLGYDDPPLRGHSIEFRINGEDAGRGFLPQPGTVAQWQPPSGPGVRLDSGVVAGAVVGGGFDSLLAKLVVTGRTRQEALERSRRALAEFVVEGMPTVLPFHRAVVEDPAFAPAGDAPFTVHTRWIETEFDNRIEPWSGPGADAPEAQPRERLVVEVAGKRLEVTLPAGFAGGPGGPGGGAAGAGGAGGVVGAAPGVRRPPKRSATGRQKAAASGDALTSPMQGTIVRYAVEEGQEVAAGDLVVVLEAMKMEQPITAHRAGTVSGLSAEIGQTVASGATICEIKA
jgi:acetyl-CoA/propionyl-CoA carboxylase biotin carboxyl carrier protein